MKVTITGLDVHTNHHRGRELAAIYPFVEWGVLYSIDRAGRPGQLRYPMSALAYLTQHENSSLHLCGKASRDMQQGIDNYGFIEAAQGRRIQLNGFQGAGAGLWNRVLTDEAWRKVEFILQCRERRQLMYFSDTARGIEQRGGKASLLFDPSGGRGRDCLENITCGLPLECDVPFGIAGGIGPESIQRAIRVARARGASWVDMESSVRTPSDKLDLARVLEVLQAAQEEINV